jgi:hypothetical protein
MIKYSKISGLLGIPPFEHAFELSYGGSHLFEHDYIVVIYCRSGQSYARYIDEKTFFKVTGLTEEDIVFEKLATKDGTIRGKVSVTS